MNRPWFWFLVILKIGLVKLSVATTVERRSEALILMDDVVVLVVVAVDVIVSDGQTQKPKVFRMLPWSTRPPQFSFVDNSLDVS